MKWYKDTDIEFEINYCIFCGGEFGKGELKKTKHHCIPRHLNPIFNVLIPLHHKCHEKINKVYRHINVKPPKELKEFTNKVLMLTRSSEAFNKKVNKLKEELEKEIKKIEKHNEKDET